MPKTDAEHLAELQTWRDNIVAALQTPETLSGFGGMADARGPVSLERMSGRSQLLSELALVEARIDELEEATPYMRESRGVV